MSKFLAKNKYNLFKIGAMIMFSTISQHKMSIFLTSDNLELESSKLWWITEKGKVASNQGLISLPVDLESNVWKGISSFKHKLLMWTTQELYLYDVQSEDLKLLYKPSYEDIDRAGWSEESNIIIEVFSHQTFGHPTDRGGFRTQLNIETLEESQISHRQGTPPPWGSKGYVESHSEVCSNSNGIVSRKWEDGKFRYYWKKIGRGGKRILPLGLEKYYQFRLIENNEVIYVCGFANNKLILVGVKNTSKIIPIEVNELIYDVCFHDGKLYVAMKNNIPMVLNLDI